MAFDSPPPSDACPELTPDNGTPTSSTPGSANLAGVNPGVNPGVNRQGEADANYSQVHEITLGIFEDNSRQASPSGVNNNVGQDNVPARDPPTGGFHYGRYPYTAPTAPPSIDLSGLERTEAIPFLSIGSPLVPLSRNPWSPRPRSDFESATVIILSASPPSPRSNTPPRFPKPSKGSPGIASRVFEGLQGLIDLIIIVVQVVRGSRGNRT